jgi:hypothetical protein
MTPSSKPKTRLLRVIVSKRGSATPLTRPSLKPVRTSGAPSTVKLSVAARVLGPSGPRSGQR